MTYQQTEPDPLTERLQGAPRLNKRDTLGPNESRSSAVRTSPNTTQSNMQLYRYEVGARPSHTEASRSVEAISSLVVPLESADKAPRITTGRHRTPATRAAPRASLLCAIACDLHHFLMLIRGVVFDMFLRSNKFLSIRTWPGYPPSLEGVSPCFPGDRARNDIPVPSVLKAD